MLQIQCTLNRAEVQTAYGPLCALDPYLCDILS